MEKKSLTITGMCHVEWLATETRIAPMKAHAISRLEYWLELYAGLRAEVNGNYLFGTD